MIKKVIIFIGVFTLILFASIFNSGTLAANNTSYGWGLPRSKDHQTPDPGSKYNDILQKYGAYYIGDTDKKVIYLTFDTGYDINNNITKILNILDRQDVNATFFVTGHYLIETPSTIQRMCDDGHIVGNHTMHHPDMTTVSSEKFKLELESLAQEYKKITGKDMPMYYRPPRGIFSEESLKRANDLNYNTIFWSLAFKDWERDNNRGWEYSYNNIMKRIHPGAIILLHTVSNDNVLALEKVIIDLKTDGYRFASLDELVMPQ